MEKRFEVKDLNVLINRKQILKNINLDIYDNDFFVIIGSNGSGKSTLIKSLVRVNNNYYGKILFNNKLICGQSVFNLKMKHLFAKFFNKKEDDFIQKQINIEDKDKHDKYHSKQLAKELSYVPQISSFPENVSIYEFVKMGLFPHSNSLGYVKNTEEIEDKINTVLDQVGILEIKDSLINEISGGQQQRAMIALALLQDTNTIVLDEPTNHLDIKSQLEIMALLHNLHHILRKTIILVTHNLQLGIKYANRICILENGEVIAMGNTHEIINNDIINRTFGVKADIGYDENNELKIYDIKLHKDNSEHDIERNPKSRRA